MLVWAGSHEQAETLRGLLHKEDVVAGGIDQLRDRTYRVVILLYNSHCRGLNGAERFHHCITMPYPSNSSSWYQALFRLNRHGQTSPTIYSKVIVMEGTTVESRYARHNRVESLNVTSEQLRIGIANQILTAKKRKAMPPLEVVESNKRTRIFIE